MAFPKLKEAQDKLGAKRKSLHEIFEQAGPDRDLAKVTSIDGDTKAKVDHIRVLNDEIDDLAKGVEELLMLEAAAAKAKDHESGSEPGDGAEPPAGKQTIKSVGAQFLGSDTMKGYSGGRTADVNIDVDLKTLFQTSAGWTPESTRGPRVVDYVTTPLQLLDVIPTSTTTQTSIKFMEETTFTNNAAAVAEGGTKPEAALQLTERESSVRKLEVWLGVTEEQLEDVPQVRAYINRRLPFMVRQRLQALLISGNGTPPNLRGILNVSGIQTQAKGADPTPDAIYKAMTKVEVTGQAFPGVVAMHPNDWQEIRLLRTSDGVYIWGSPADAGPARIWGVPVTSVQAMTEGTAVVGDFANYSELAVRKGMTMKMSDSHDDYFITNKTAVLAEMRAAFVVYRPAAFCQVTGI